MTPDLKEGTSVDGEVKGTVWCIIAKDKELVILTPDGFLKKVPMHSVYEEQVN